MSRRTVSRLHRWIAVPLGAFILMWTVSGTLLVVAPRLLPPPAAAGPAAPLDLAGIALSPAEAVARAEPADGAPPRVQAVTLRRIDDVPVYSMWVEGKGLQHIDARTGDRFTITPERAERLARRYLPGQATVSTVELVTERTLSYPWGPLPAYRVSFNGADSAYYVAAEDGAVDRFDARHFAVGAIISLHTFEPIRLITTRDGARQALLVGVAAVAIGLAATGYLLALPRRRATVAMQKRVAPAERPLETVR